MFEHISEPVLPRQQFVSRLRISLAIGSAMLLASLAAGMLGYRYLFINLDWADAFVNAAMILSGMGPLAVPQTNIAKIFSGIYALYSGLILLISVGVIVAPLAHRFLHKMHADEGDGGDDAGEAENTSPRDKSRRQRTKLTG